MKRVFGILGIAAIAVLVLVGGALGTHEGGRQFTIAKTNWPEKEGVSYASVGHAGMRDSCVEPSPFDLPSIRPRVC